MKYRSFVATLWIVALTGATFAEEARSAAQKAQREARALMGRGLEARAAGDNELARDLYLESFEKYPSFDVACNLARAESDLGRFVDAANHFVYCLGNFPTGESLAMKQEAMDGLERARQYATELTIEVSESGALVLLDTQEIGQSPLPDAVFVAPGEHDIVARSGGREVAQHVNFGLGTKERVSLTLPEQTPVSAPADSVERVPVNPGLRVATSLGLLGLGVAGIGVGVGFSVYGTDQRAEADALREVIMEEGTGAEPCPAHPSCGELAEAVARSEEAQNVALVGFIGGGAFVVAAGISYFLWPHRTGSAVHGSMKLAPVASFDPASGRAWFAVSGRF